MSVQNMLEPIKLHKTPKGQCQNEPWDLSISHQEADTDISGDLTKDGDNVVNLKENVLVAENDVSGNDRPSTPVLEPGMHTEMDETDKPTEVPPDKLKSALDNLCHTWSEVKLHRLTNSELECYLGKVNENIAPTPVLKGDNIVGENLTADQTPPLPALSQSGRPLRCAAAKLAFNEPDSEDSDSEDDVTKKGNKSNSSKPSSSGPSALCIAAQNKRTESPSIWCKTK